MSAKSIYFFLIPEGVSRDNYAHNSVVLAEGLRELGWEIYANIDYWRSGPDDTSTLFRHDRNVQPADCAVNVLTYDWMHFVNVMPFQFAENRKSYRVYLEDAGWLRTPGLREEFRQVDLVLKSHYNRRAQAPPNYRPWSFGLSRRILAETNVAAPFAARQNSLLVNFGATHSYRHQLRDFFEERVYPRLAQRIKLDRAINSKANPPTGAYHRFMWEQTGFRHYPDYYERLRNALACSCIGGQLISSAPHDWSLLDDGHRAKLRRWWFAWGSRLRGAVPRWNQWESWRFWECLAAGCAALMLDFEKYGAQLPVPPENWKHYIGLDLDHLSRDLDRVQGEQGLLPRIAESGRDWAIRHYSPKAVATLFLGMIGR